MNSCCIKSPTVYWWWLASGGERPPLSHSCRWQRRQAAGDIWKQQGAGVLMECSSGRTVVANMQIPFTSVADLPGVNWSQIAHEYDVSLRSAKMIHHLRRWWQGEWVYVVTSCVTWWGEKGMWIVTSYFPSLSSRWYTLGCSSWIKDLLRMKYSLILFSHVLFSSYELRVLKQNTQFHISQKINKSLSNILHPLDLRNTEGKSWLAPNVGSEFQIFSLSH